MTDAKKTGITKADNISYRPRLMHLPRIAELAEAMGVKKAWVLDQSLEAQLPELEKRYARELAEHRARVSSTAPARGEVSGALSAAGQALRQQAQAAAGSAPTLPRIPAPSGKARSKTPRAPRRSTRPK